MRCGSPLQCLRLHRSVLIISLLSQRRCIVRAIESDRVIVDESGSRAGNQTQRESVQPFRFGTWPSTCLDTFKECLYNRRIFCDAEVTVTAALHDRCAIQLPFPVVLAHLLYVT